MSEQRIVLGDCLDVFRDVRGLQAIVSDPPAGIGMMGRKWDMLPMADRKKALAREDAFSDYWAERFDVARTACVDDAVALIWALPRTQDLTMRALRLAGWTIRDVITHHFGQGWPKDKNALKPSTEMWILAVKGKPALGIDACRVERSGGVPVMRKDGALWGSTNKTVVTGDRIAGSWPTNLVLSHFASDDGSFTCRPCGTRKVRGSDARKADGTRSNENGGLWDVRAERKGPATFAADGTETVPAYLCAVGCDCGRSWLAESGGEAPRCECGLAGWWCCPVAELDSGGGSGRKGEHPIRGSGLGYGGGNGFQRDARIVIDEDTNTVSRFFPRFTYHAKAPSNERHAGCEDLFWRVDKKDPFGFVRVTREEWEMCHPKERAEGNVHPTPKRLALMRWLHALTGAKRIGDLCGGSGSGMVAAHLDGIEWIGAEICPQAIDIATARLAFWKGLSFEARDRFLSDDEMPVAPKVDERQASLF